MRRSLWLAFLIACDPATSDPLDSLDTSRPADAADAGAAPLVIVTAPGGANPDDRSVVQLQLPETDATATFHERREYSLYAGTTTWVGDHPDRPTDLLVVTARGDVVAGYANVDGRVYSISGTQQAWQLTEAPESVHDDAPEDQDDPLDAPGAESLQREAISLELGPDPATWGPYAGYDEVIDVLFVHGPPALAQAAVSGDLIPRVVTGVAVTNEALHNSDVQVAVRLVGIEDIGWDSSGRPQEAFSELLQGTYGADGLDALRDARGADVVVGIPASDVYSSHGVTNMVSGVAQSPALPGPSTTDKYRMVVTYAALTSDTFAHELGHVMGLGHGRDGNSHNSKPSYAFGYHWPDQLVVTDPNDVDEDCEPFRTIMSKKFDVDIGGVTIPSAGQIPRVPYFANPDVVVTRCPLLGPVTVGTGSLVVQPLNGKWADAARSLEENAPAVADYRDATSVTFGEAAVLTSPTPGGTLSGTTTFSWSAASPVDSYVLELYNPTTGSSYAYAAVTGTTTTISGLPTDGSVVAARLWTDAGSTDNPQWTWVDHRYNNDLVFVDCGTDPGATGLDPVAEPQWAFGSCSDALGPVCTYVAGEVTCDLDRGAGGTDPRLHATSAFYSSGEAYDLMVYGYGSNSADFCCLLNDPGESVDQLRIEGSSRDDLVFLYDTRGRELTSYGPEIEVIVDGRGGDDVIQGSNSDDADYRELLRGGGGLDTLYGRDGDDVLRAGSGGGVLFGGAGDDVLLGGSGTDELYGEQGHDDLCTDQLEDKLLGSFGFDLDFDKLYVSQGASGVPHPDTEGRTGDVCGHTTHGSFAGPNCLYSMNAAPSECADLGLPD